MSMYLSTVQANVFSLLNDALKEIVYEVNFCFSPEGLSIKTMDTSQSRFINLQLNADKFDEYRCEGTHILGIDMTFLHKLLKGSSNSDVLILSYNELHKHELCIEIHNNSWRNIKKYNLKLMDLDNPVYNTLPLEDDDIECSIQLDAQKFKSICKDLQTLSEIVEITSTDKELRFSCKSDVGNGSQTVELVEKNNYAHLLHISKDVSIIQGIFSLKHLYHFTKFSNICQTMQLSFANNKPLRITYACSDLGNISLYLAEYM
jgi:proliferating cell nuclear antigen